MDKKIHISKSVNLIPAGVMKTASEASVYYNRVTLRGYYNVVKFLQSAIIEYLYQRYLG